MLVYAGVTIYCTINQRSLISNRSRAWVKDSFKHGVTVEDTGGPSGATWESSWAIFWFSLKFAFRQAPDGMHIRYIFVWNISWCHCPEVILGIFPVTLLSWNLIGIEKRVFIIISILMLAALPLFIF